MSMTLFWSLGISCQYPINSIHTGCRILVSLASTFIPENGNHNNLGMDILCLMLICQSAVTFNTSTFYLLKIIVCIYPFHLLIHHSFFQPLEKLYIAGVPTHWEYEDVKRSLTSESSGAISKKYRQEWDKKAISAHSDLRATVITCV